MKKRGVGINFEKDNPIQSNNFKQHEARKYKRLIL